MPRAKREVPVTESVPVTPEVEVTAAPTLEQEKPKRARKAPAKMTDGPVKGWIDPATITDEAVAEAEPFIDSEPKAAAVELPTFKKVEAQMAALKAEEAGKPALAIAIEEAIELTEQDEGGWSEEAKTLVNGDPNMAEFTETDLTEYTQQHDDIVREAMADEGSMVTKPDEGEEWVPSDEEIEAMLAEAEVAPPKATPAEYGKGPHHPDLDVTEIGTAEFVDYAEDGSPEWHELRSRGLGGSDAASVLGIGFKSAYVLWMEKKGHFEPIPPEPRLEEIFEWGHLQEPAIAEKFTRLHPEWTPFEGGSWRKKDAPWMLANPDRLLVNEETGEISILEIKTSETGTGWDNDRCPSKYVVQLRHYLWVFGLEYGYLVVKVGNSDYREFLVPADVSKPVEKIYGGTMKPSSFTIQYGDGAYLQVAEKNFLDAEEPPAMDGNKDIYEQIRRKNLSLDRGVEVELPVDVGTALAESSDALDRAEKSNQEARNHVMAHMGTAQYATYNGSRVASRVAKGAAAPYLKVG